MNKKHIDTEVEPLDQTTEQVADLAKKQESNDEKEETTFQTIGKKGHTLKAFQIDDLGCIVQVGSSLVFVPGAELNSDEEGHKKLVKMLPKQG